jgi:hypothetical protein
VAEQGVAEEAEEVEEAVEDSEVVEGVVAEDSRRYEGRTHTIEAQRLSQVLERRARQWPRKIMRSPTTMLSSFGERQGPSLVLPQLFLSVEREIAHRGRHNLCYVP